MVDGELTITRMDLQSASLLQISPEDHSDVARLAARAFGNHPAGHSAAHGPRAYSIGPTEWLLINYSVDHLRRQLRTGLGRAHVRLTDVSAAFTSFKVEGSAARTVLANDISSSWVAHGSQPGQYVRTQLGQVEVLLHCVGPDAFELHVDRGAAEYLKGWLDARRAEWFLSGASDGDPRH
ncbi:MAG TPA: sarcosine oxidase subunit gamma family protein [Steroidobacteraceae bacterium]|nr:sarcosine oxidase subunit gamma family protein [Steroidobacteraceae bacterium]